MITGPIRQDGPIDHIVKNLALNYGRCDYNYRYNFKHITLGGFKKYLCMDINICIFSLGALGLLDDILKIRYKKLKGLKSSYKFLGQLLIGLATLFYFNKIFKS